MNKAPKKIWYSFEYEKRIIAGENEEDIPYIRADLVDGLVEALKLSAFHMHKITTSRGKADYSVVRAALAALKEEE